MKFTSNQVPSTVVSERVSKVSRFKSESSVPHKRMSVSRQLLTLTGLAPSISYINFIEWKKRKYSNKCCWLIESHRLVIGVTQS